MRLNRILRRQKGFTLLETMIAMAVLSFGVLSLASFYTQGLRSSDQVQMQYIANQKAQQALETIFTARDTQLLSFSQLNNVSAGGRFQGWSAATLGARARWARRNRRRRFNQSGRHHYRAGTRWNSWHARRHLCSPESLDDAHNRHHPGGKRNQFEPDHHHH